MDRPSLRAALLQFSGYLTTSEPAIVLGCDSFVPAAELTEAVERFLDASPELIDSDVEAIDLRVPENDLSPLSGVPRPPELADAITMQDAIYIPSADTAAVIVVAYATISREELSMPVTKLVDRKRKQFDASIKATVKGHDFARRLGGAAIALVNTATCEDCRAKLWRETTDPTPNEALLLCRECGAKAIGESLPGGPRLVSASGESLDPATRNGVPIVILRDFD